MVYNIYWCFILKILFLQKLNKRSMKHFKVLSIAALAIIALLLSGCKKDEDPVQKPASMGVSASRLDYAADGGSQAIRFYSNRDWSAQINYSGDAKDWLTVTPNSAKAASDSITVSFTAKANEDGARNASVVFSNGSGSVTVNIAQEGVAAEEYVPISQVRALYKGSNVKVTENWTIKGYVVSDYRKSDKGGLNNATSAKCVVLQDKDAGIQLRLVADNESIAKGDEISVSIKGLELQRYQDGAIQVNNVPNANIKVLSTGNNIEAITVSAAEFLTGKYESMYIAIPDVQKASTSKETFVKGTSHTSINFVSKTGEAFVLFSSSYSTFGKEEVPTGSGVLKGIAMVYNKTTYQMSITSKDDYSGLTGERFSIDTDVESKITGDYQEWSSITPLTVFYDDFSNAPDKGNEYECDSWMFYTSDGTSVNYGWKSAYYSWNKYMDIAPYNSVLDEVVSFALLPPVNVSAASVKKLNLKLAFYYQDEDDTVFEVVVSDNFQGDFESATWTVVDELTFDQGAQINNWVGHSIDLSQFTNSSSLAVAFRYTGKMNTYRLDNVSFGCEPDVEEFNPGTPVTEIKSDMVNKWMELPVVTTTDDRAYISHHSTVNGNSVRNYSMLYDTEYRIALWTAYHICSSSYGPTSRTDNWNYDPKVPKELQPTLFSSWGESGIDRGHILPSATRTANVESNSATFYFTNMTAQSSDLNQGVWGNLENEVRDYAATCDTLYVVTGSVLKTEGTPEISFIKDKEGKEVAKPQAYFKVLLKYDVEEDSYESIAFWYENKAYSHTQPVADDTRSVAWVEQQTGYTFFDNLPEGIKKSVKEEHAPGNWGL